MTFVSKCISFNRRRQVTTHNVVKHIVCLLWYYVTVITETFSMLELQKYNLLQQDR